ncbi:RNA polymerase sigma factor [Brevundimonas sp. NIBR11]|uniref:RNA polymerase sigma factor n=1 Tax=Brevundimonas sp. NIBR11 TaxID=3015999 RepID=UPI0022F10730|nr:RNA polymerase sigma factor [Brevundimonas sp. NIBR11]
MDAGLVREARAGSDAAFARLVERHQAPVRAFLRRMLGRNWDDADDLAQDVFVAAWGSLGRLKDVAGFRSWLLGIAWRKAQDRMRSGLRSQARDRSWLDEAQRSDGISEEDRLALADAMAELPTDQRACVALCLADGWSHGEAAEALGLPLGTVKSHVARGRARLLAVLTGGSDDA